MTYNAEQITFMLAEAIDQDREYKSWHVNTKHLMTLVEMVVAEEREACAKVCETLGVHPALNVWNGGPDWYKHGKDCAEAIRARGTSMKPTAWYDPTNGAVSADKDSPLFTPLGQVWPLYPKQEWVGLTDKEIEAIWVIVMFANYGVGAELSNQPFVHYAKAIEAKLKDKNVQR